MGSGSSTKRVQFEAQDNGVVSLMDKLRRSAKDLSKDLIADAIKYSSSAKEQNKYLSEQIALIDKRNRLETEGRKIEASKAYQSQSSAAKTKIERDEIAKKYKSDLSNINQESSEDNLQVKYLKEIVEAIKTSAKEEIKDENIQENKTQSFFSRIFGGKKKEIDPEEEFKNSNKRGDKAEKKESESNEKRKSGGSASGAFNNGAQIATQGNELAMAAAAFAIIPMIGQGISTIANKLIQEGSRLQESRLTLGRISGNPNIDIGKPAAGMGVDQAEFMNFSAQMAKNRGYSTEAYALGMGRFSDSVQGAALRLQGTKQMYGVSDGSLLGFDKLQRLDSNRRDTAGDIQNLIKYLKQEGAFGASGKDMASLEEFMHIQTTIMQDQSKRLESVNTNSNASVIASFQRLGGTFANPVTAGERISTMNNAIVNPGNDFKQAMVYSALRKLNPDADLFDLQKKQEEGIFGEGTLSQVMKDLTNRGGSSGNKKIMLKEMFGLSANQSGALFDSYQKGMNEGKDPFADIASRNELFKKYGLTQDSQFVEGGTRMTGSIDRLTAKMTNRVAPLGEGLVNKGEKYINKIEDDGLLSGATSMGKDIAKATGDAIKETFNKIDFKGFFVDGPIEKFNKSIEGDLQTLQAGLARIGSWFNSSSAPSVNPTYVPKKTK